MDWIPVVFIAFKSVVFCVCMFFAIKWHYDQDKKKKLAALEQQAAAAEQAPSSSV